MIEETIKVKGAEPEKLRVRVSRHGPVISDVFARGAGPGAARPRASPLPGPRSPRTTAACRRRSSSRARADWDGFLAAARDFQTPQQNIVYADVEGNIGFVAAGRVPHAQARQRPEGHGAGAGLATRYDWAGYIPFEQLPRSFNPPSGAIVTANHRITPPGYPHFISSDWEPPYRADRIQQLLDATPKHDVPSFARIQADVVSLAMRELLPKLLATRPRSEEARKALALLAKWDGAMAAERAEPLIAWAWWRELDARASTPTNWATPSARTGSRARCSSPTCSRRPEAGALVRRRAHARGRNLRRAAALSLEAALADLQARYGSDRPLALGRGARRAPRAPAVRPPAAARARSSTSRVPSPATPTP